MNESQTRLLIQRELDGNLSQEDETRLKRVLQVSDSAVSFRANLSQVVAAAHDLELPDEVRPGDSSRLAVEIMENLPAVKGNFWDPLFDIFSNRRGGKNMQMDPRSSRSVGSGVLSGNRATAHRVTSYPPQGKGTGLDSSQNNTAAGAGASRSKVDPAVYAPKKEPETEQEKNKTPYGLPAVDQYVTGTHSALGGLAKKLSKNINATQAEDVGKTLADAIREKVHEAHHAVHEDADNMDALVNLHAVHAEAEPSAASSETHSWSAENLSWAAQSNQSSTQNETQRWAPAEPHPWAPAATPPQPQTAAPAPVQPSTQDRVTEAVLPLASSSPHLVHANITTQQRATTVNLGSSLVLTVASQNTDSQPILDAGTHPPSSDGNVRPAAQPAVTKGHDFAQDDLMEWKSGTYPTVPPPAKPQILGQTETGPLVPFPTNTPPSISKLNLKNTAEIMKQLEADTKKEKPEFPQWVTPSTFNNQPAETSTHPAPWTNADWPNTAWSTAQSVAPPEPWTSKSAIAPPETAWVPPPTPDNPAPPADPWAPPSSAPAQSIQSPWAPEPVQAAEPTKTQMHVPKQQQTAAPVAAPASTPASFAAPAPASAPKEPKSEDTIPTPTIVPVTRQSALPIDAIGDRINELFAEPHESKPPTVVSQPAIQRDIANQENPAMENDVKECLSSIGRLADVRYATNNPGNIKDLGRFLLNDETIGNIGNVINKGLSHSNARVVTLDAAQQMASALDPVMKTAGVVGYMLCGYDALPISSSLPPDVDIELLGGCTMVAYMNSHNIMRVMGHTRIKQMILNTPGGCMLLADFGKGILVTLTNSRDAASLAGLTDTIASIAG